MQVVDSNNQENFGEWVKALRKAEGFTQEELANKMGIASPYISRIETGDRPPTEPFCIALAGAFGFPIYTVLLKAGLIEESAELVEANTKRNETEDSDVLEFKRKINKIKDKDERERTLDNIWALLELAARRSARHKAKSEGVADRADGKGGRPAAADQPDPGRPPVPHR